jgi:N-acetyl-gamma-glutamyl-phosphate reductase
MKRIGIVGGTGYTGAELIRLALTHGKFEVACVTSRGDAGTPVTKVWPSFAGFLDLDFTEPDPGRLAECDLVFFATPNGTAMTAAPELLARGVRIIDLSADFRLKSIPSWEHWYGMKHESPELVAEAVYGLPELNREAITGARLVANPGCYPTATALGLIPLLAAGIVEPRTLIADAKSGVSGAGRKASLAHLYGEVAENFHAYAVDGHRHYPEIVQTLNAVSAEATDITFVPHLLPMFRGIHVTLYARLRERVADLQALYRARYDGHPFVRIEDAKSHPDTRAVYGTNLCRISAHQVSENQLVVLSVIDNLTKGAAGQAVQNANLMFGFPETQGLTAPPMAP